MPEPTVEEPKTDAPAGADVERTPQTITPNMRFRNKYAIGDRLWVVFTIGPNLRVNQFTVKSFNAEVLGFDEPVYIYGFTIGGDGHEDSINLSHIQEELVFFDRQKAEEKAKTMEGDLLAEYDRLVNELTKKFEGELKKLTDEKDLVSANDLKVPDRVAEVPRDPAAEARQVAADANAVADKIEAEAEKAVDEAAKTNDPDLQPSEGIPETDTNDSPPDEQKADPETPEKTPDNGQSNPESDVEKSDRENEGRPAEGQPTEGQPQG